MPAICAFLPPRPHRAGSHGGLAVCCAYDAQIEAELAAHMREQAGNAGAVYASRQEISGD